jgi:C4-dicarboxylate transporter/malic acid transport protein
MSPPLQVSPAFNSTGSGTRPPREPLISYPPHASSSPQYYRQAGDTKLLSRPPSSCDDSDSHLDDLEKSLPIDTIPSLRLHVLETDQHDPSNGKHHEGVRCSEVTPAHDDEATSLRPSLPLRRRLEHFTWAWYTLTMSTGGLSLLLQAQPHPFPGLRQIGLAVYVLNIVLFCLVTTALAARFVLFRGALVASVTHPREGFFVPTLFLSLATLITSTQRYCVPADADPEAPDALRWAIRAAFWVYVALTTGVAVGQYSYVFGAHSFGLQTMMPTWILPIFPIMLSGTIASVVSGSQPADARISMLVAGLTCQGLGIAVAFMMYAHMVGRLMQSGLPHREHRTGLFMCVGPPAFTALAFIGLAQSLPPDFDRDMDGLLDANIIETMAVVGAGFLWALSFWWFGIAVLAVVRSPPRFFHLGWWAAVFPNTGFTLATIAVGTAFHNDAVLWFATAMSILLVLTYCFVLYHNIRAVVVQDIMYPGRDEDVEDH